MGRRMNKDICKQCIDKYRFLWDHEMAGHPDQWVKNGWSEYDDNVWTLSKLVRCPRGWRHGGPVEIVTVRTNTIPNWCRFRVEQVVK